MSNTPILPPLPVPVCVYADHSYPAFTMSQMEAYARSAIALNAPAGLTMDDAFTVKGHAVFLRMEGQTDMPDYFDGLAERIKALAAPAPQRDAPAGGPDTACVICPACTHQFRAIPVDVQQLMLGAGFEPPFTASPPLSAQSQPSPKEQT